jgi:aryl-alcohol dehydrogenase-like predicted oxidoreductase
MSLRRLGLERIDLFQLHRIDPKVPLADQVGELKALQDEGKIRYIGLSEVSPETIRRAHVIHPITAVQSEYSLFARDPEKDGVLATCRELGIGFVPSSPLGRGVLTGKITSRDALTPDDHRRDLPWFAPDNIDTNLAVVNTLKELAAQKEITPAQLALAWLHAQDNTTPIPGTKHRRWLEQNVAASRIKLTNADLAAINAVSPPGITAGARNNPDVLVQRR